MDQYQNPGPVAPGGANGGNEPASPRGQGTPPGMPVNASAVSASSALPGPTALFGAAWRRYSANAMRLSAIYAFPTVLLLVLSWLWNYSAVESIALVLLTVLVYVFVSVFGTIALFVAIHDPAKDFVGAYKEGALRFFPYLWVSILLALIVSGLMMLFFVPGILASVWFALAALVFVVEDKRGMLALFQSKAYVEGHWWGVLGRLFFMGIVFALIYAVIVTAFSFLLSGVGMSADTAVSIMSVVSAVLAIILAPIATSYIYELYASLRASWTPVEIVNTSGRKAKFIVPALIGILLIPFVLFAFFTSVYTLLFFGNLNNQQFKGMQPVEFPPQSLNQEQLNEIERLDAILKQGQ